MEGDLIDYSEDPLKGISILSRSVNNDAHFPFNSKLSEVIAPLPTISSQISVVIDLPEIHVSWSSLATPSLNPSSHPSDPGPSTSVHAAESSGLSSLHPVTTHYPPYSSLNEDPHPHSFPPLELAQQYGSYTTVLYPPRFLPAWIGTAASKL